MATDRITFPGISSTTWEHPADRAALNALRKIPAFDVILRKLVGMFGEKAIRLSFKANAVKVSENQYPWLHEQLLEVCEIFDVEDPPELYVSQHPVVAAGAVGLDNPFIVLNSSLLEICEPDEVRAVLGHEVGHILSGHALYRTMLHIMLQFSSIRFSIANIASRPLLYALLEWSRKAELSCDRAGLLVSQDLRVSQSVLMRLAGGSREHELDLDEFVAQSREYRERGDVLASVYRFLSLLGTTHPFAVLRVAELSDWAETGELDRILAGNYRTHEDDAEIPYSEDAGDAAAGYTAKARVVADEVGARVGTIATKVGDAWRSAGNTPN